MIEQIGLNLWLYGALSACVAGLLYIGDKIPDRWHKAFTEALGGSWEDVEGDQ